MTHRFRVTLASLVLFTLQGACASLSTLESARTVKHQTFSVETVVLGQGYTQPATTAASNEADENEEQSDQASRPRIQPISVALVGRDSSEDIKNGQVEFSLSSAGNLTFGFKYQFIDLGPLAASAGFKLGTDLISFIDFLTDEEDESDDDEFDLWKKQVQVALPLIISIHPLPGFDLYASGRAQWLGSAAGYHKLLVGTAGACFGKTLGFCAEAGRFYSSNTEFDGYYGAFSVKFESEPSE